MLRWRVGVPVPSPSGLWSPGGFLLMQVGRGEVWRDWEALRGRSGHVLSFPALGTHLDPVPAVPCFPSRGFGIHLQQTWKLYQARAAVVATALFGGGHRHSQSSVSKARVMLVHSPSSGPVSKQS